MKPKFKSFINKDVNFKLIVLTMILVLSLAGVSVYSTAKFRLLKAQVHNVNIDINNIQKELDNKEQTYKEALESKDKSKLDMESLDNKYQNISINNEELLRDTLILRDKVTKDTNTISKLNLELYTKTNLLNNQSGLIMQTERELNDAEKNISKVYDELDDFYYDIIFLNEEIEELNTYINDTCPR